METDKINKSKDFVLHTTDPVNGEPDKGPREDEYITPPDQFYIRNHGPIPDIDPATYILRVNGLVQRALELSFDTIVNDFPKHTVMATLQCAGNRREELIEHAPVPGEVPWQQQAVGNAVWSGARLKDILLLAGVQDNAQFAEFMGAEPVIRHDKNVGFGASIPIEKALSNEVLLAYEMNGLPLEPTHGFPIRVVVPGYIGARSVKWLTEINLLDHPSENYFQNHAYQLFPYHENAETVDWHSGIQLSELQVNCVIIAPKKNAVLPAGKCKVHGWAISGGGRSIARVDVSADGGNTWQVAKITQGQNRYAWTFWETDLNLSPGQHLLVARAFDIAANTQPEKIEQVWNFKGYMNNAWHKVMVEVK